MVEPSKRGWWSLWDDAAGGYEGEPFAGRVSVHQRRANGLLATFSRFVQVFQDPAFQGIGKGIPEG